MSQMNRTQETADGADEYPTGSEPSASEDRESRSQSSDLSMRANDTRRSLAQASISGVGRVLRHAPWILWVLIAIVTVFAVLEPDSFATETNARNVALDVSTLLVMAVGSTFVLVAAGIDLSIGSVLVLSTVLAARVLRDNPNLSGWTGFAVAALICLVTGFFWGVLNGAIIAYLKVNPLITTLGTMGMSLGLAYILSGNGADIPVTNERMSQVAVGRLFGQVPSLVVIAVVVAIFGGLALQHTTFGRHTAAIGSNMEAAERVGINVRFQLLKVYGLSGMLSGLCGFMSLMRFSTTTILSHSLDILDVITGVILGGTSMFGGVGTMIGTVTGMTIPAVLQNGFIIVDIQPFWQKVAVGAVLIAAVYVDQLKRNRNR